MYDDTLFYSPCLFNLWDEVAVRAHNIISKSGLSISAEPNRPCFGLHD